MESAVYQERSSSDDPPDIARRFEENFSLERNPFYVFSCLDDYRVRHQYVIDVDGGDRSFTAVQLAESLRTAIERSRFKEKARKAVARVLLIPRERTREGVNDINFSLHPPPEPSSFYSATSFSLPSRPKRPDGWWIFICMRIPR